MNIRFWALILKNSASQFGAIERFEGKTIEVTGKMKSYHEKPEIMLNSPSQLNVVK
jgi:DNA/RNA endonuclease YhcR with UshA esterase domain